MAAAHSLLTVTGYLHAHLATRPVPTIPGLIRLGSVAKAMALLTANRARLITHGTQPFYDPIDDVMCMPPFAFYCLRRLTRPGTRCSMDLLHELVHWSGHRSRLARPRHVEQFDAVYNREELIAEIGAALLMHDLAIAERPVLPHAKYLHGYLCTLPNPRVELDTALARANQATGFLLAVARQRLAHPHLDYA